VSADTAAASARALRAIEEARLTMAVEATAHQLLAELSMLRGGLSTRQRLAKRLRTTGDMLTRLADQIGASEAPAATTGPSSAVASDPEEEAERPEPSETDVAAMEKAMRKAGWRLLP